MYRRFNVGHGLVIFKSNHIMGSPGVKIANTQNPTLKIIEDKGFSVADDAAGSNFSYEGLEVGYPHELWCVNNPATGCELH